MNNLNYDLQLLLIESLNRNNILACYKLFELDNTFYSAYLYQLRKQRHVLTCNEIQKLQSFSHTFPNNINLELLKAIEYNQLQVIKYLITKNASINDTFRLAFQKATQHKDLDNLRYLARLSIYIGNDLHVKYKYIQYLTRDELVENIESSQYSYSGVALRLATKMGYFNIIKYLVEQDANLNVYYNDPRLEITLDNYADKRLRIIRYLIKKSNINDTSILASAVFNKNLEVIKYLITKSRKYVPVLGAVVNNHIDIEEILNTSIRKGYLDIVKYLIKQSCKEPGEVIGIIHNGSVYQAVDKRKFELIDYLVELGINLSTILPISNRMIYEISRFLHNLKKIDLESIFKI